jgi:hypothetical protein
LKAISLTLNGIMALTLYLSLVNFIYFFNKISKDAFEIEIGKYESVLLFNESYLRKYQNNYV